MGDAYERTKSRSRVKADQAKYLISNLIGLIRRYFFVFYPPFKAKTGSVSI